MHPKQYFNNLLFILISINLILFAQSASAKKILPLGDWVYIDNESYKYARTRNIHKLEFGVLCDRKCTFIITPALICNKAKTISGWMIEQTGVSIRIDSRCVEFNGNNVLKLENYDAIWKTILSNNEVHFIFNFDVQKNSLMTFNLYGSGDVKKKLND
jgi:hypothetical protein